ncbi:MAG: GGDEF domain-containing protein [Oligoflexus sp.]
MKRWIIQSQKKYLFLALGLLYSLMIPVVWLKIESWVESWALQWGIYLYLFLTSALIIGFFSYLLGYTQDMLYQVLEKDPLTELLNQQAFFRRVRDYYQLGIRYHDEVAMMMLDIDHFKEVNDQYSHFVGSQVLKQLALLIQKELRRTDIAARFGGDEFIIFLPRTDFERANLVAERLRELIATSIFVHKDHRVHISASFGVIVSRCRIDVQVEELAEAADQLLYRAKDLGRNRVCAQTREPPLQSTA